MIRVRRSFAIALMLGASLAPLSPAAVGLPDLVREFEAAKTRIARARKREVRTLRRELEALARRIGKIDTEASREYLLRELGVPDPEIAAAVAGALLLGRAPGIAARIVGAIDGKRPAVRLAVLRRLLTSRRDLSSALDGVREQLPRERDAAVRSALVVLLARHAGAGAAAELARLYRRSRGLDIAARAALLDALVRSGSKDALEVVAGAARRGGVESRAIALGSLGLAPASGKALEVLLGALRSSTYEVRNAALRSLSRFRDRAMVGPLIDLLAREKRERLRIDALEMLVKLTGKNMGLVVADWRKWWDAAGPTFELPSGRTGTTRVVPRDLEYFGIEVRSKNIAFVVDASNSMLNPPERRGRGGRKGKGKGKRRRGGKRDPLGPPGSKMAIMKEELTRILRKLPDDTLVNILAFNRSYTAWAKRLTPLRGGGRRRAIEFVEGLRCALLTNVYDTLEFALRDPAVDTIYLLSDGQPVGGKFTKPQDIIREIAAINRVRGVTIHTISFGKETALMKRLALDSGGTHRRAR